MSNKKIPDGSLVSSITGPTMFEVSIGGATQLRGTADQLKTFVNAGFVKADGSVPLTSDWDAGSYKITAETIESNVASGTAPFVVASTTNVLNLNADKVDGYDLDQGVKTTDYTTFVGQTLSGLTVAGGILRNDGSGVISSSDEIPDGTKATTQISTDNSTKLATTAFAHSVVSGKDEFNELTDVIAPYAKAGALTIVKDTTDGMVETDAFFEEDANSFKITKGTSTLQVDADLVVSADSAIDQDLKTTASPEHVGMTLSGLTTNNTVLYNNGDGDILASSTLPYLTKTTPVDPNSIGQWATNTQWVTTHILEADDLVVTAATGITPINTNSRTILINVVSSTAGDASIDFMAAGGHHGQLAIIRGTSNTQTVTINNGNTFKLESGQPFTLGLDYTMYFIYNSTHWIEISRSSNS